MHKKEKIFSSISIIIILFLLTYSFLRKNKLNENPVYVIAKIKTINETENGLIYNFTYRFNQKEFSSHLKGFLKLRDSLIILKISIADPKLWELIQVNVPNCMEDSLNKTWKEIPICF